jgi:flavin reductase (DIM6/NTAB) family NADH-FMN oxidoreductase RutF
MSHRSVAPGTSYFYYPRLVCVVGVRDDAKSSLNLAPVAWATPLSSDPPLFGVCLSPRTYTHHLLLANGEFTINFLAYRHAAVAEALGKLSGREVDKVKSLGLEVEAGEAISTALLAIAYAAAECLLVDRHHVGDQTLCVGEVVRVHLDDDAFGDDGVLRLARVAPLLYLGSNHYVSADPSSAVRPGPERTPVS